MGCVTPATCYGIRPRRDRWKFLRGHNPKFNCRAECGQQRVADFLLRKVLAS